MIKKTCQYCGKELGNHSEAKFCVFCGKNITLLEEMQKNEDITELTHAQQVQQEVANTFKIPQLEKQENLNETKIVPTTQTQVSKTNFCISCGKNLEDFPDVKYCVYCGKDLGITQNLDDKTMIPQQEFQAENSKIIISTGQQMQEKVEDEQITELLEQKALSEIELTSNDQIQKVSTVEQQTIITEDQPELSRITNINRTSTIIKDTFFRNSNLGGQILMIIIILIGSIWGYLVDLNMQRIGTGMILGAIFGFLISGIIVANVIYNKN